MQKTNKLQKGKDGGWCEKAQETFDRWLQKEKGGRKVEAEDQEENPIGDQYKDMDAQTLLDAAETIVKSDEGMTHKHAMLEILDALKAKI